MKKLTLPGYDDIVDIVLRWSPEAAGDSIVIANLLTNHGESIVFTDTESMRQGLRDAYQEIQHHLETNISRWIISQVSPNQDRKFLESIFMEGIR